METFRSLTHLFFDATAALLYTASIAIVFAGAAIAYTQLVVVGFFVAAISFVVVASFYGRKLWRTYRLRLGPRSPMLAH